MIYNIKVKPRSPRNDVEILGEDTLIIHTTKIPKDNEANESVVEILSERFNVNKNRIKIISGKKSRNKIIKIE